MRHNTQLIGIVNVTPDSFSDGGKTFTPENAVRVISQLIQDGAHIVDIGAESTRPGATPVTPAEEWARLEPVLKLLPAKLSISIDTRHAQTAGRALAYPMVKWINDVSGFSDLAMVEVVKNSQCKLVVMHSLSVPADSSVLMPESADVIEELLVFGKKRIADLGHAGIARGRIIFDPGIGFNKTPQQSKDVIYNVQRLKLLDVPILIGHSRKSFLGGNMNERDIRTLNVSHMLVKQGVDFLRVHNIVQHHQMLEAEALSDA